jgi:acetylglutamate kinase
MKMKYCVIKCGGSVLENLPQSFFEDIVHLYKSGKVKPVIVHGGGPLISSLLTEMGIKTKFVDGLRVTTEEVLDIVEMVLSGTVNKRIVRKLIEAKGQAYGISGVDGLLLKAEQSKESQLGYVGEVTDVNKTMIEQILNQGYIPVISPLGIDEYGQRYNINGDVAASAVAKALGASLCMISDIPGIYTEENGEKVTLKEITKLEIEQMIQNGFITGGMIPKVKAAIDGLVHEVPEVVILNGMENHSLLDYAAGKETGTKIVLRKEHEHVH